jgi:LPS export ABC transporter protein LptC
MRLPFRLPVLSWPRWATPLLLAVGVSGMAWYFWRDRAHNPVAVPQPVKPDQEIELRFHDAELRGRKNGVGHWSIRAKRIDVSRDQRYAYLKDHPTGTFYNIKDWNPSQSDATAKSRSFDWSGKEAEYDSMSNNLMIKGNVVIRTDAKEELKTERVNFYSDDDKVDIPGKVTIIGDKGRPRISADKLDADLKLEVLSLQGHVKIDTVVGEGQQIK